MNAVHSCALDIEKSLLPMDYPLTLEAGFTAHIRNHRLIKLT
jgi:hypothetical protein